MSRARRTVRRYREAVAWFAVGALIIILQTGGVLPSELPASPRRPEVVVTPTTGSTALRTPTTTTGEPPSSPPSTVPTTVVPTTATSPSRTVPPVTSPTTPPSTSSPLPTVTLPTITIPVITPPTVPPADDCAGRKTIRVHPRGHRNCIEVRPTCGGAVRCDVTG